MKKNANGEIKQDRSNKTQLNRQQHICITKIIKIKNKRFFKWTYSKACKENVDDQAMY